MRKILYSIAVILLFAIPPAFAQANVNTEREGDVVGFQLLNPVASTALTVPATAEWCQVCIRNAGAHVRFDAIASTTTTGAYFAPGCYATPFVPRASYTLTPVVLMARLRFIDSSDGASTLYVVYFKRANH